MEIKLLPLICPECGRDIIACERDNLYFCSGCGRGFEVRGGDWKSIETKYAKPLIEFSTSPIYLPFWHLKTEVKFEQSVSMKDISIVEAVLKFPEFTDKMTKLLEPKNSEVSMDFFVPAFGTTNRWLLMDDIGLFYTISSPEIVQNTPKEMVGGKYSADDALKLCNSILFSIESKTSKLIGYDFEISLKSYKIIGVPFFENNVFLIDGLMGKKIFADGIENFEEIKEIILNTENH